MRRSGHGSLRPMLASVLVIGGLLSLVPGSAIAADTRQLYVGSPSTDLSKCPAPNYFCPLDFSGASSPSGATVAHSAADVVIANLGSQTLTHITVAGGLAADSRPPNSNFPHPSGLSVPSPLSISAVFVNSGNPTLSCPVSGNSFTCNIGTLLGAQYPGSSVAFRLVISVPSGASTSPVWLLATLNETSVSGKNQDTFYAVGSVGVLAATCGLNQNYFLPSERVSLQTPAGCQQSTTIQGPNTTVGSFASVGTDPTSTWCPTGYVCKGILSLGNVNNGQSGPVIWTIGFAFNPSFVIHFQATYDPSDPLHAGDYDVIPFNQQNKCGAPHATMNCWISVSPPVNGIRTAIFQTATNTSSRGG